MLALVKEGKIQRITEKRLATIINVWVRCPGLVVVSAYTWVGIAHGTTALESNNGMLEVVFKNIPYFLVMVLAAVNGIYYMHQIVANYHALTNQWVHRS